MKVLIIEDEYDKAEFMSATLKALGIQVEILGNDKLGSRMTLNSYLPEEELIERLQHISWEEFDLFLLDDILGTEFDGRKLMRILNENLGINIFPKTIGTGDYPKSQIPYLGVNRNVYKIEVERHPLVVLLKAFKKGLISHLNPKELKDIFEKAYILQNWFRIGGEITAEGELFSDLLNDKDKDFFGSQYVGRIEKAWNYMLQKGIIDQDGKLILNCEDEELALQVR